MKGLSVRRACGSTSPLIRQAPDHSYQVGACTKGCCKVQDADRHNIRNMGTLRQMGVVVRALEGRYITYAGLTKSNELSSGVQS